MLIEFKNKESEMVAVLTSLFFISYSLFLIKFEPCHWNWNNPPCRSSLNRLFKTEDKLAIRDFLDDQNISDVAGLVDEFPEYEDQHHRQYVHSPGCQCIQDPGPVRSEKDHPRTATQYHRFTAE